MHNVIREKQRCTIVCFKDSAYSSFAVSIRPRIRTHSVRRRSARALPKFSRSHGKCGKSNEEWDYDRLIASHMKPDNRDYIG